jgi:hypothetical protein
MSTENVLYYDESDFEFLPEEPKLQPASVLPNNGNGHHHVHDGDEKLRRARAYIRAIPGAVQGEHGDQATYEVAAKMRDFGLSEDDCYQVMAEEFNLRCVPPWNEKELWQKVRNAYRYATGAPGSKLAQDPLPHPNDTSHNHQSDGGTHTGASDAGAAPLASDAPPILDPADPMPSARRFVERF